MVFFAPICAMPADLVRTRAAPKLQDQIAAPAASNRWPSIDRVGGGCCCSHSSKPASDTYRDWNQVLGPALTALV